MYRKCSKPPCTNVQSKARPAFIVTLPTLAVASRRKRLMGRNECLVRIHVLVSDRGAQLPCIRTAQAMRSRRKGVRHARALIRSSLRRRTERYAAVGNEFDADAVASTPHDTTRFSYRQAIKYKIEPVGYVSRVANLQTSPTARDVVKRTTPNKCFVQKDFSRCRGSDRKRRSTRMPPATVIHGNPSSRHSE